MRGERRVGCKQDPAEWVHCWFAANAAQPSELGAKDESGKAVGTAATAYFFMRDPTDVGGGGKKKTLAMIPMIHVDEMKNTNGSC